MIQIYEVGTDVAFLFNHRLIAGKIEAIAELPYYQRSYLINSQWYSHVKFEPSRNGKNAIIRAVDVFYKIPVILPDYWLEMIGYENLDCRYAAIYYQGSKPTWISGWGMSTFSYYTAYSVLINHFAIAYHLLGTDLGSDDTDATHVLIMDCLNPQGIELYLAPYDLGMRFVHSAALALPTVQLSAEELEQVRIEYMQSLTHEKMQHLGMFELFGGHSRQQRENAVNLLAHLNYFITEELIKASIVAAQHNAEALIMLQDLVEDYRTNN